MPTVKEYIENLKTRYKDDDYICAPIWVAQDVRDYASSQMDVKEELDDEFCEGVLEGMGDNHDASVGINWDVIGSYIDAYLEEDENDKFSKMPEEDLPLYIEHEFKYNSTRKIFNKRLKGE